MPIFPSPKSFQHLGCTRQTGTCPEGNQAGNFVAKEIRARRMTLTENEFEHSERHIEQASIQHPLLTNINILPHLHF